MCGLPSQDQWKEKVQRSRSYRPGMLTASRILLVRCHPRGMWMTENVGWKPELKLIASAEVVCYFLRGMSVSWEREREREKERETEMSRWALRSVCLPCEKRYEDRKQWAQPKCKLQFDNRKIKPTYLKARTHLNILWSKEDIQKSNSTWRGVQNH